MRYSCLMKYLRLILSNFIWCGDEWSERLMLFGEAIELRLDNLDFLNDKY